MTDTGYVIGYGWPRFAGPRAPFQFIAHVEVEEQQTITAVMSCKVTRPNLLLLLRRHAELNMGTFKAIEAARQRKMAVEENAEVLSWTRPRVALSVYCT